MKISKSEQNDEWPKKIRLGRVVVTVYRRKSPKGHTCFQVRELGFRLAVFSHLE